MNSNKLCLFGNNIVNSTKVLLNKNKHKKIYMLIQIILYDFKVSIFKGII